MWIFPLLVFLSFNLSCCSSSGGLSSIWTNTIKQSLHEQEVEDQNSLHKFENHLVRRLIAMPLTDAFNPNQASAMHGKVQYGDKCSLPSTLGKIIFEKPYEVPWLFEVIPVKRTSQSRKLNPSQSIDDVESEAAESVSTVSDQTQSSSNEKIVKKPVLNRKVLNKAYISPLDFRSPENYIFLPEWLMKDMNLAPNDLVDISFVRIKLAALVVLQPLTEAWDSLIETHGDPKALLEHEINKYSSLTAGATIAIEIKGVQYPLFVKEVKAEGGISVLGVRVQDSDIKVDIDRGYLDALIKYNKQEALKNAKDGADNDTPVITGKKKSIAKASKKGK